MRAARGRGVGRLDGKLTLKEAHQMLQLSTELGDFPVQVVDLGETRKRINT